MGVYDWIDPFEEIEKAVLKAEANYHEGRRAGIQAVLSSIEHEHGAKFGRWLECHLMRLTRNMVRRAIPPKLRAEMEGAITQAALAERMAREALAFGTATFRMRFEDGALEPEVVVQYYDPMKERLDELLRLAASTAARQTLHPDLEELLKRHASPT